MLVFGQPPRASAVALPTPAWAGIAASGLPSTDLAAPRPAPHCLTHHILVLATAGHGTIEIDFADQPCRPGTLLWARPGQALRFGGQPGLDAAIISFDRDLDPTAGVAGLTPDDPLRPVSWQLTGEDEDVMINEFTQLAFDCRRHSSGAVAAELLRHQLAVLLLRIALLTAAETPTASEVETRTFAAFRSTLEQRHAQTRRVEDYATELGCSVRTLTRASLALTGRTAKQVIDDRVALAARRLLACTSTSVAEVGRRLGFPEPTNFGRFFQREVGESPGAFRALVGHAPTPRVPIQRPSADSL